MDGRKLGPYTIVEKLGAGGMGEVYRARDDRLERDVAIKRLAEEAVGDSRRRRMLMREARSIARITHQNVAALHDVFEDSDELYLVMELVDGETLTERCQRGLTLDTILAIAVQCGEGLAAAHRQGVVHGDVKPDNVMISADGDVKILDFGVARIVAAVSDEDETRAPGENTETAMGGTVPFMAPEVLLGNEFDHRVDIFSLGVTLYWMLTGAHPFAANTAPAVVDRILHDQPIPIVRLNPRVPEHLSPILDKMLAKSPDERYATIADLLVDLRAAHMRLTNPIVRPSVDSVAPARAARPGWLTALATLTALAAVTALAVVAWRGTLPDNAAPASAPARFEASDWIIAVLAVTEDEDAEMAALNEGLAATLTSKLTQMSRAHSLQVIPVSALRRRQIGDYSAARQEFGVTLAIDFQLRRVGEQLRVNVNLIDTRQDRQLDAATVDGSVADPIDLEEQVALRALRMLRLELLPMEQGLLEAGTAEPRAHGYYLRATGYLQEYTDLDSIDAAVTLLEQALRVDPEYARAHAALGEALWNRYDLTDAPVWVDRAAQECQAAIDADPDEGAGYRCLGTVYNGTGRAEEAADALERAKRLDPTDDATYIALGNAYLSQGRLDLAEATYEEAIALRPHYWGGYSELGVFYLRHGRTREAIENLERVVSLAPDSYRGFSNLGAAYYFAEEWSLARQAFEQSLKINPEFASAITNLGTVYFYEGSYAESAEMFERAVALAERRYLNWGNLADAYYWTEGQRERAGEAYRRAIDLAGEQLDVNPNDAETHSHVARYHAMLGAAVLANDHLNQALATAPTDIDILHSGAQIYAVLGDTDRALDFLRRAVEAGYQRAEIRLDPIFNPFREDPRYQELMAE